MESKDSGMIKMKKRKIDQTIADCSSRRASKRKRQASIKGREAGISLSLYGVSEPPVAAPQHNTPLRPDQATYLIECENAPNSPIVPRRLVTRTAVESRVGGNRATISNGPSLESMPSLESTTKPAILEVHFLSDSEKTKPFQKLHFKSPSPSSQTCSTNTTCSVSTPFSIEQPLVDKYVDKSKHEEYSISAIDSIETKSGESLMEDLNGDNPNSLMTGFEVRTTSLFSETKVVSSLAILSKLCSLLLAIALLMVPVVRPKISQRNTGSTNIHTLLNTSRDVLWSLGNSLRQEAQQNPLIHENYQLKENLTRTTQELHTSLQEKTIMKERLQNNTIALEEAILQALKHEKGLIEKKKEKENLLKELDSRQSQLSTERQYLTNAEKQVKELAARNSQLESMVEGSGTLDVQLDQQLSEAREVEHQKQQLEVELQSLSRKLDEANVDRSENEKALEESKRARNLLQNELDKSNESLGELESVIVQMQKDLEETKKENSILLGDIEQILSAVYQTVDDSLITMTHEGMEDNEPAKYHAEIEHWTSVYQSVVGEDDMGTYAEKVFALQNIIRTRGEEMSQIERTLKSALLQKDKEVHQAHENYKDAMEKMNALSEKLSQNPVEANESESKDESAAQVTILEEELRRARLQLNELNEQLDANFLTASQALNSAIAAIHDIKEEDAAKTVNFITGKTSSVIRNPESQTLNSESRALNDAIAAIPIDSADPVTEVMYLVREYIKDQA